MMLHPLQYKFERTAIFFKLKSFGNLSSVFSFRNLDCWIWLG